MTLKKNGSFISYFFKDTAENDEIDDNYWIIADENMHEVDTLRTTIGITDYHDIRLLDNGNYILQYKITLHTMGKTYINYRLKYNYLFINNFTIFLS